MHHATASSGSPSPSAVSWARVVSWPWPCGCWLVNSDTVPSCSRRARLLGRPRRGAGAERGAAVGRPRRRLGEGRDAEAEQASRVARRPAGRERRVDTGEARSRVSCAVMWSRVGPVHITVGCSAVVTRFRRRTSAGSKPSSRATRSIIRSRVQVSDSQGPRNARYVAVLLATTVPWNAKSAMR